jgi:hypothetical protein
MFRTLRLRARGGRGSIRWTDDLSALWEVASIGGHCWSNAFGCCWTNDGLTAVAVQAVVGKRVFTATLMIAHPLNPLVHLLGPQTSGRDGVMALGLARPVVRCRKSVGCWQQYRRSFEAAAVAFIRREPWRRRNSRAVLNVSVGAARSRHVQKIF